LLLKNPRQIKTSYSLPAEFLHGLSSFNEIAKVHDPEQCSNGNPYCCIIDQIKLLWNVVGESQLKAELFREGGDLPIRKRHVQHRRLAAAKLEAERKRED
jgi:hypothetical protein